MNLINQQDVLWFEHHQQTLHLADIADVLGQLNMHLGAKLPCDQFAQQCLPCSTRPTDEQMRKRVVRTEFSSVVEVGIECGSQYGYVFSFICSIITPTIFLPLRSESVKFRMNIYLSHTAGLGDSLVCRMGESMD